MTLAERVVASPHVPGYEPGEGAHYQEYVRAAMKVEATNVYRWCDENLRGQIVTLEEVDCGRPPSDNLWLEWWPWPDIVEGAHVLLLERGTVESLAGIEDAALKILSDARVARLACCSVFVGEISGRPIMTGTSTCAMDADDRILWHRTKMSDALVKLEEAARERDGIGRELMRKAQERASVVFAYTCSFANCSNVTMVEQRVPRQQARRAARKGEWMPEFKVLRIDPMVEVVRAHRGAGPRTDVRQGLHICRGHFSKYGEKFGRGKLFGKLEGRFWVPKHVRGNPEVGIIEKEYEVAEIAGVLKSGGKA